MLVGDKISSSLPQITIEEALNFLQYDQSQLVEMQRVLAPRFSSSLTRSFLIQQFQQTQMQQYYPVVDYIPPY